jgi:RTX calcium-binding nonapeptide repeat (4 copies)
LGPLQVWAYFGSVQALARPTAEAVMLLTFTAINDASLAPLPAALGPLDSTAFFLLPPAPVVVTTPVVVTVEPVTAVPPVVVPVVVVTGTIGDDLIQSTPPPPGFAVAAFGLEGSDTLAGQPGTDLQFGGPGDDELQGLDGDDAQSGGPGDDRLFAGLGNDVMAGGEGNDAMEGGLGADTFIFNADGGHDTIGDFERGVDTIHLHGFDAATFTDLLQQASVFSSRTMRGDPFVQIGFGNASLTVVGISELTASDVTLDGEVSDTFEATAAALLAGGVAADATEAPLVAVAQPPLLGASTLTDRIFLVS